MNGDLPVIALLGRPNVGKSTLFNRLTGSRDALVAASPGLTRDRRYGYGRQGPARYVAVDTGGMGESQGEVAEVTARQSEAALAEADAALVVVDAREGLTPVDEAVVDAVRRSGRPAWLVVNKAEGREPEAAAAEFHALGLGVPAVISAHRGQGVTALMDSVLAALPPSREAADDETGDGERVRLAVVGRPNVGKSTLTNRILGEERVVVHEQPGTTRDSIAVPFERDGRRQTLIDTAGLRRKARVDEAVEKFSAVQTLQAIEAASVAVLMVDAREGVVDQDAAIADQILERGRAVVVAINKWDGLSPEQRRAVRRQLDLKLGFLGFAQWRFVSALHGTGVGELLDAVATAHEAASRDLPTADLTRVLHDAVAAHAPPLARGRRIKLRYAHQGARRPPTIVVHGTQAERVPAAYRRFLANTFREAFELEGTPVRIELRSPANPYAPAGARPARKRGGAGQGSRSRKHAR